MSKKIEVRRLDIDEEMGLLMSLIIFFKTVTVSCLVLFRIGVFDWRRYFNWKNARWTPSKRIGRR